MTEYQERLVEHFRAVRQENVRTFTDRNEVLFSDIFRFRGILGQGQFGIVILVEDKLDGEKTPK